MDAFSFLLKAFVVVVVVGTLFGSVKGKVGVSTVPFFNWRHVSKTHEFGSSGSVSCGNGKGDEGF